MDSIRTLEGAVVIRYSCSILRSKIVPSRVPVNPITRRIFFKPDEPEPELSKNFQYPRNPNPKLKPEGTRKSMILSKIDQITEIFQARAIILAIFYIIFMPFFE